MSESSRIAEHDLELVHALQVSPRASFAQLGQVLGTSPVTLGRRWERLRQEGLAWVAATPSRRFVTAGSIAYVEVRCQPARRWEVAMALAQERATASVDLTAGSSDLMLSIATSDLKALSTYLIERVDRIPGIRSTNTFLATRSYLQGGDWQVAALNQRQIDVLRRQNQEEQTLTEFVPFDRALLLALGEDGRMSHVDLAERTGTSPSSVRRRISRLVSSGAITLRCDIAAPAFGWPVSAHIAGRVTPARLSLIAAAIARMPSVRLVTTVTGSVNLFIGLWLHSIDAVTEMEEKIGSIYPDWQAIDRIVVLQSLKRAGRLLDAEGRATGTVPMVYLGNALT